MTPPPTSDAENAMFSRKCYRSITQRERRDHNPALQKRYGKQQFICITLSRYAIESQLNLDIFHKNHISLL